MSAQIGQEVSDAISDSAIDEDSSGDEPPKSDEPDSEDEAPNASESTAASNLPAVEATADKVDKVTPLPSQRPPISVSSSFIHPSDLAAQLASHPKLAALRTPSGLAMTPASGGPSPTRTAPQSPGLVNVKSANYFAPVSPPLLINPKCSGYFVEPVSAVLMFDHSEEYG